jgi:predicted GIY-YIG superfamily endonuclease
MELPQHYNIDTKILYIGVAEDLQQYFTKHVLAKPIFRFQKVNRTVEAN